MTVKLRNKEQQRSMELRKLRSMNRVLKNLILEMLNMSADMRGGAPVTQQHLDNLKTRALEVVNGEPTESVQGL
jgi:hypothetical protein